MCTFRYNWDTLVKDVMGEDFKLSEEFRTERATMRDLLGHKMGLAYYGATALIGLGLRDLADRSIAGKPFRNCRNTALSVNLDVPR